MTQILADEFDVLSKNGFLPVELPVHITENLADRIVLRPYQVKALQRWLYYVDQYAFSPANPHLLFHMATGSGKTVLMAALMLDLYKRGYRNFLFFVNSSQIVEKTKENFYNSASSKHLFAPQIRIGYKPVDVRLVEVFDSDPGDAIHIHFTTIQGLHSGIHDPSENTVTYEDFNEGRVVLLSDEAHHLNSETKKRLNQTETQRKTSWERTVERIFQSHPENILLEFTATIDLDHEMILNKYRDKVLYDYSLRQFREDGYSKDIVLRQADLSANERMMQAMVLSQYRRKLAEVQGIHCKPVILMKSKTIKESKANYEAFTKLVAGLSVDEVHALRTTAEFGDQALSNAFNFVLNERELTLESFVLELQGDFGPDKVLNVNELNELEREQVNLNQLEDRDNELRVIFAVNKLDEGWDVLNLFDIVRLYNTRDGRDNKVGRTTVSEAQLIGRGARYFPFSTDRLLDASSEMRKFDSDVENPLRILEELHYHCFHNPQYIVDIRTALRAAGMLDLQEKRVELRVKDSFKQTSLYGGGFVWVNERIKNPRTDVHGLNAYKVNSCITVPSLLTGRVTESSVVVNRTVETQSIVSEPVSRKFKLVDFGGSVLTHAMDANPFFHFNNLQSYFPRLTSSTEFQSSNVYLGSISVSVRGLAEHIDQLTARQKLDISQYVLKELEECVRCNSVEFVGSKNFKPHRINNCFADKTIKQRAHGESGRSWQESKLSELEGIDLETKDWYVYDDSYGTDQEKYFINFLNEHEHELRKGYDDFYVLRNEKAVKLFGFENGQGFEPDFVLFLCRTTEETVTVHQLFIEPKGEHLMERDAWKESFLTDIENQGKLITRLLDQKYFVYGLPFFNVVEDSYRGFEKAFERFLKQV